MKEKGLLLAVDTSTHVASVALYDGVRVRAEHTWEPARRHTVELAPLVAVMLSQANVQAAALTGLAVAVGPGSFTGLRIGLALVKGLALARGIPVAGIPTLDVTVYPVPQRRTTLYATLQAGRGRICVAPYRWRKGGWQRTGEATLSTWPALADAAPDGAFVCGEIDAEGMAVLKRTEKLILASPAQRLRRAGYLAELGWTSLSQGVHDDPATLQLIYLPTASV